MKLTDNTVKLEAQQKEENTSRPFFQFLEQEGVKSNKNMVKCKNWGTVLVPFLR